eukprot:TRINITY_DN14109_c0_g1_i1.p1 TRINITY_DN14109_c0_g1~~TRINITY_DN14109_c0_g1_i1.p1  ORF type:complete len:209 (-),score=32.61 TRINITY_DN14109_c0_g1_i1:42-668(-)
MAFCAAFKRVSSAVTSNYSLTNARFCAAAWKRTLVFASSDAHRGVYKALHDDVSATFTSMSSGHPKSVSAAQLVQILFEVGAVDLNKASVSDVLDELMWHGFYRQTHPHKRDSYGAPPVPTVGLDECKRWSTLFLAKRLIAEERHGNAGTHVNRTDRVASVGGGQRSSRSFPNKRCGAVWCQCGRSGSSNTCALQMEALKGGCSATNA